MEGVKGTAAAAVGDVVENRAIAAAHVDGFDNGDVDAVFDHAGGVAWRLVDVDDAAI